MYETGIVVRFTRIFDYVYVLLLIFPLIFLISPHNLFSYKTVIIFFANLCLTAFGYVFNDLEDAVDDYHDVEKRGRNPVASGEVTRRQSYLFNFFLLFVGLSLLVFISPPVFFVGLVLALVGFVYSWRPLRLKSMPVLDLVSHVLALGALQFLITYLAFRPLDLSVAPFLMVIVPASMINEIIQEMNDFDVDSETSINNTIQRFERSDVNRLLAFLVVIVVVGLSIILFSVPLGHRVINLLLSVFVGVVVVLRVRARVSGIPWAG